MGCCTSSPTQPADDDACEVVHTLLRGGSTPSLDALMALVALVDTTISTDSLGETARLRAQAHRRGVHYIGCGAYGVVVRVCTRRWPGRCGGDAAPCGACVALKVTLPPTVFDDDTHEDVTDGSCVRVHAALTARLAGTPAAAHFNRLRGACEVPTSLRAANGRRHRRWLALQDYEPPLSPDVFGVRVVTLHDALEHAAHAFTERDWMGLALQLLGALTVAARAVPAFEHGDLHSNNILLVPNARGVVPTFVTARGVTLRHVDAHGAPPRFLARIIDFDYVHSSEPCLCTSESARRARTQFDSPAPLADMCKLYWACKRGAKFRGTPPAWLRAWYALHERHLGPALTRHTWEGGTMCEWGDPWHKDLYSSDPARVRAAQAAIGLVGRGSMEAVLDDEYFAPLRSCGGGA